MTVTTLERSDHVRDEDMPTAPAVVASVAVVGFPLKCSTTIGKIATALAEAQKEFPKIEKDKEATVTMKSGGKYSYSYADLSSVFDAVMPVLSKNGIGTMTPSTVKGREAVATPLLLHASGEWICGDPLSLPIGDVADPRSVASAITYARRYSVMALLGLAAAEEDDDAEKAGRNGRGHHPPADRNRQEVESRQGPKPAQRQSQQPTPSASTSPAAVRPEPEPKPVTDQPAPPPVLDGATGKIAAVVDLPSGAAWSIKLESGWKCGTRDKEAAAKARELMAAGTECEIAARPNTNPGFAPMLEWIDVVKPEPPAPREPGSDDE